MPYLHITENVIKDDRLNTVTVIVETDKFTFEAVGSKEGDVNIYVDWGEDQSGDLASHPTWVDARAYFRQLLNDSKAKV